MEIVVIGGGCYGTLHARQLLKAHHRGRFRLDRLVVVDRHADCRARGELAGEPLVRFVAAEWHDFLLDYLAAADPEAQLVPAPYAPHLLLDWLETSLARAAPGLALRRAAFPYELGLPYEHLDGSGNRYLSWAAWRCPPTCIEPATCPKIRQERGWDLGETLRQFVAQRPHCAQSAAIFTCLHFGYGIGTIPVRELLGARERLRETAERGALPHRALVATVSHCHGVVNILELAPAAPDAAALSLAAAPALAGSQVGG